MNARQAQLRASMLAVQRNSDGAFFCMAHAPSDWADRVDRSEYGEVQPWTVDLEENEVLHCEGGHNIEA